jgi:hypothetical protein
LFTDGKIKFVRPDGSIGEQPGYGNALIGMGEVACNALRRSGLGHCVAVDRSAVPSLRRQQQWARGTPELELPYAQPQSR